LGLGRSAAGADGVTGQADPGFAVWDEALLALTASRNLVAKRERCLAMSGRATRRIPRKPYDRLVLFAGAAQLQSLIHYPDAGSTTFKQPPRGSPGAGSPARPQLSRIKDLRLPRPNRGAVRIPCGSDVGCRGRPGS
jgi:hypothetical protein